MKNKRNKCYRNIKEATTMGRSDLHSQVKKFKCVFIIEKDKFILIILIPFLLKDIVLFGSNMPKGNFV